MSENRKLANAIISFVIVASLCWVGVYVMTYPQNLGREQLNSEFNEVIYGNVIGSFLFILLIFSMVVYFIAKYLISDLIKSNWWMKIQGFFNTFR